MRAQDFDKRKNASLPVRDKEDTHGSFILVFQTANLKLLLQQSRFSRELQNLSRVNMAQCHRNFSNIDSIAYRQVEDLHARFGSHSMVLIFT